MAKYTKQDIINMIEDEDVEFIRMQFTDIEGNFKNNLQRRKTCYLFTYFLLGLNACNYDLKWCVG